jgi:hypothetical protein
MLTAMPSMSASLTPRSSGFQFGDERLRMAAAFGGQRALSDLAVLPQSDGTGETAGFEGEELHGSFKTSQGRQSLGFRLFFVRVFALHFSEET